MSELTTTQAKLLERMRKRPASCRTAAQWGGRRSSMLVLLRLGLVEKCTDPLFPQYHTFRATPPPSDMQKEKSDD